jgi:hypothetical protein
MNWWIVKQLRAMVLSDLRNFVPQGYFESETDQFNLSETIKNSEHLSYEIRWGYLAGRLGQRLFFRPTEIMTARQVSASDVLMNLGLLAGAEAAEKIAENVSESAKAKNVPDGNAGIVAYQIRAEHIPTLSNNVRVALTRYLMYLSPSESRPFEALLENIHLAPNSRAVRGTNLISSSNAKAIPKIEEIQFEVAFSFPGEKRNYVSEVVEQLRPHMEKYSIFYDLDYQAQLARPNLDTLLQDIYRNNSKLIVVFLCREYSQKVWCGLEWRTVRDIIKETNDEKIMFVRFDDAPIKGIFSIDGYIDANKFFPKDIAEFILERLACL